MVSSDPAKVRARVERNYGKLRQPQPYTQPTLERLTRWAVAWNDVREKYWLLLDGEQAVPDNWYDKYTKAMVRSERAFRRLSAFIKGAK